MEAQIENVHYSSVPACEISADGDKEECPGPSLQNFDSGGAEESSNSCHVSHCSLLGALLCLVLIYQILQHAWGAFESSVATPSNNPTPTAGLPPLHYNFNGKKCFATNRELKDAVDFYLIDKANETLEQVYGLPIGLWCTKYLDDFSAVFAVDRNPTVKDVMKDFNDDISAWDVSSAVVLDHLFRGLEKFDQDLSQWSVSNVQSMVGVFQFTKRFNGGTYPSFSISRPEFR